MTTRSLLEGLGCRTDERRGSLEIEVVVWTRCRVRHSFRSELRRHSGSSGGDILDGGRDCSSGLWPVEPSG
eukprot:scaffold51607_cov208-Isochrysis_galbana.AAC.1